MFVYIRSCIHSQNVYYSCFVHLSVSIHISEEWLNGSSENLILENFPKKKSSHFKFFLQWKIVTVTLHKMCPCFCTHIHKYSYPIITWTDYWHPCSAYVQFLLYIGKVLQVWKIKQDLVSPFLGCGTEWLDIWFSTFYSLVVPLSRVIKTSKHWEPNIQWCGLKIQKNWQAKSDF